MSVQECTNRATSSILLFSLTLGSNYLCQHLTLRPQPVSPFVYRPGLTPVYSNYTATDTITVLYSKFYNLYSSRKIKDSEPKESRRALDLSTLNFFMLEIMICMCVFFFQTF